MNAIRTQQAHAAAIHQHAHAQHQQQNAHAAHEAMMRSSHGSGASPLPLVGQCKLKVVFRALS